MPAIDSAPVVEEDLESEEEDLGAGTQSELDLDAAAPEPKLPFYLNSAGNVRFGADVIRGLGMLPESCVVLYEPGDEPEPETPTAFEVEHEEEAPAADAYDAYDTYDEDVELEQDYSEEDTNDEASSPRPTMRLRMRTDLKKRSPLRKRSRKKTTSTS